MAEGVVDHATARNYLEPSNTTDYERAGSTLVDVLKPGSVCSRVLSTSTSKKDSIEPEEEVEDPCCICLDQIKDRGKLNSCNHRYCFSCIKRWSEETNTCPQCKKRFTKLERVVEDGEEMQPSKKRRRKNVVHIKNKNIEPPSGIGQLSGILARVFEHFALRPVEGGTSSFSSRGGSSGVRRIYRLERRPTVPLPPTSAENPICLDSDDTDDATESLPELEEGDVSGNADYLNDTVTRGAVRSEVESDDEEREGFGMGHVMDIPSLIRSMRIPGAEGPNRFSHFRVYRRRMPRPTIVNDGMGISAATAIELEDSEDEETTAATTAPNPAVPGRKRKRRRDL